MDPNETLRLIRLTITQMRVDESPEIRKQHADDLAEQVEALDGWLSSGGFKPLAWENFGGLKTPDKQVCADCGLTLHQQPEKALSGEFAMVWADVDSTWVCPTTGNEHRPERTY